MAAPLVTYGEIRETLLTGDLVLMQGVDVESDIIRALEHSPWSHVAMVIRMGGVDPPLLWESTPLHFLEDVVLHSRKSGARIVSLDERLRSGVTRKLYRAFALRRLKTARSDDMLEGLRQYIENVHLLPFPSDWELARLYIKGRILDEKSQHSSLYCAELIAETYMRMGLLAPEHPANWYIPKDFSSDRRLPLLKKARLQKEILFSAE
jgi:hypothetical protein